MFRVASRFAVRDRFDREPSASMENQGLILIYPLVEPVDVVAHDACCRHYTHSTGMSALHLSAYEGDANLVRGRIELGQDPNARDEVGFNWYLHPLCTYAQCIISSDTCISAPVSPDLVL